MYVTCIRVSCFRDNETRINYGKAIQKANCRSALAKGCNKELLRPVAQSVGKGSQ